MFISKITLENFRIYYGKNELEFPKSNKKNVFIVSGNNGYGKTSLLNSLVWCLYGKLMGDVDDKFRKEIYESGGYKKYASNCLNKRLKEEFIIYQKTFLNIDLEKLKKNNPVEYINKTEQYNYLSSFSVSIVLTDLHIPSLPCKEVKITRTFNTSKNDEDVEILIDGTENELTKEVGQEIFISDFILPKEIAKFFFFDAEKIVTLAEIKSIEDKKSLSKAYSEVLGLKKYEDLKTNLEDLRIRFRRNSASDVDKQKFEELQKEINQYKNLIKEYESQISILKEEKISKRQSSEQYQEKLIREGNSITIDELADLRKIKNRLIEEADQLRVKLKELLDLAPFAIAGNKFIDVNRQLLNEEEQSQGIKPQVLNRKINNVKNEIIEKSKKLKIDKKVKNNLLDILESSLTRNFNLSNSKNEHQVLLQFSDNEKSEFEAIYNNLKLSFQDSFKKIVFDYKQNRIFFNKVVRKLSNAEAKENDLLVKEIRAQKDLIDKRIEEIDNKIIVLSQEIGGLQKEIATKTKISVELAKKINLEQADFAKDQTAERLIEELDEFIRKLKLKKKVSLEDRIKQELNKLMHKRTFISKVEVEIGNDIIDINLFDKKGEIISKEALSKGEQQLYATALLKSLVDESNIKFPVFIDSPLQKFDKQHSRNIICEFYPKISDQVVLFPLLEKELTEEEYNSLLPKVNSVKLIDNIDEYHSQFKSIEPSNLFKISRKIYDNVN